MQELLKYALELVGGISVVVCNTLVICKGVFEKYIYTQIKNLLKKSWKKQRIHFQEVLPHMKFF